MKPTDFQVAGIFPTPIYIAQRETELDNTVLSATEQKEIEEIIENGMMETNDTHPELRTMSKNKYIFNDGKLKDIKEFCEDHIDNYVKEIMNPRDDLEFYITQSWLNFTEPNQFHHRHEHPNSVISGVLYLDTDKDNDTIKFFNPIKYQQLSPEVNSDKYNFYNSSSWWFPVESGQLIMFPSSTTHQVDNKKGSNTRISLAFNTFYKGSLGVNRELTELKL